MRERPILFSAPMVRAILAGRKTQTRRIVKLPHANPLGKWEVMPWGGPNGGWTRDGKTIPFQNVIVHSRTGDAICCPFGEPGDRLWVREAWRIGAWDCDIGGIAVDYCDAQRREWLIPFATKTEEPHEVFERLWIDCCDELAAKGIQHDSDGRYNWQAGESPLRWRPSIHMPRWASRILLEITRVRVERLKNISPDDCIAEGAWSIENREIGRGHEAVEAFRSLWESINGDGSWAANPWVWVVEFRRVEA